MIKLFERRQNNRNQRWKDRREIDIYVIGKFIQLENLSPAKIVPRVLLPNIENEQFRDFCVGVTVIFRDLKEERLLLGGFYLLN